MSARARALVATSREDHLPALRVGVGLALPGIALVAAGRPDLLVYAVFGSFVGMYGRTETYRVRLRHQAQAAGVLFGGVGAGLALSASHAAAWVLVVSGVLFGAFGSLVTDQLGLRPAGPFFGIFALGAIGTIPIRVASPWIGLAIFVATALLCVLVGQVGALRREPPEHEEPSPRAPTTSDELVHALRYGLAVGIAGAAASFIGLGHINWAMAGAAVPLAAGDARGRISRGLHRVVGTVVGLLVTALILLPDLSSTLLAVIVIVLLYPTELFMNKNYGLAIGFFTPLIMLMIELADPSEPMALLEDRVFGTLVGVAVGVAVALAPFDFRRGDDNSGKSGRTGARKEAARP